MRHLLRVVLLPRSRCTGRWWLCFAIVSSSLSWLGESSTFAQPAAPAAKKAPARPPERPVELKIDPDFLPPNFQPPPKPLAIMELDQPIVTSEELAKLKVFVSGANRFTKALRNADLSTEGRQAIEGGIRYRLAVMTLPENRRDTSQENRKESKDGKEKPAEPLKDLPELHKKFMTELGNIGQLNGKPQDIQNAIQFVHGEIVKQIVPLLTNNFYVRLHGVLILSELDFAPANVLLLQVIQAKDFGEDEVKGQPEAIKIAATQGLIRILRFAVPQAAVKDRTLIAHALVEELLKPDIHPWYQRRLVEALRYMDISIDVGNRNQPFVVDALLNVIGDAKRLWIVRAKACLALGRVPVPAGFDHEQIVTVVTNFALQLSKEAAAKPAIPYWKNCFMDVYLGFKPLNDKDLDAGKKAPGGFLNSIKAAAQPAYNVIVPIVRDALQGKSPAAADVQKLETFMRARTPANGKAEG